MNTSFSKKRHIKDLNILLENRIILEKETQFSKENLTKAKSIFPFPLNLLISEEFIINLIIFYSSIEKIEKKAKELYGKNMNTSRADRTIQEDAFAHITGNAFATSLFGKYTTYILGLSQEIKGALKMFFVGDANNPAFTKMDSGFVMDTLNNSIGIKIGEKYPNKNLDFFYPIVKNEIDSGNFYDKNGVYQKTKKKK